MKRKWLLATTLFAFALGLALWMTRRVRERYNPTYGGKTASEWFFGKRTAFRREAQMRQAEAAFRGLGTNAFPFLVSQLKQRESWMNPLYFQAYPRLPNFLRTRAPLPISRSDIQFMALYYLEKIKPIPAEWANQVALCIPELKDSSVRFRALQILAERFRGPQDEAWFVDLMRTHLKDSQFFIQLDAAIRLSDRANTDAETFSILLRALLDYQLVSDSLSVRSYTLGFPPGTTNRSPPGPLQTRFRLPDQATMTQLDVLGALDHLEPRLDSARREQLWLAFATVPTAKNPESLENKIGITPDDVRRKFGSRVREGIRVLSGLLKDPDPARRAQAARALGWFGEEAAEAIPSLKAALEDSAAEVRSCAANALAKMPSAK